MTRAQRRVLFWFFITLFFVLAPLAVLYTAGFRYNPTNGGLEKTGGISIVTSPRGADITLDGDRVGKSSPHVLKRLLAGNYTVHLEKRDFHPWEGTVDVLRGRTSFLESILLFWDGEPELIVDMNGEAVGPSRDGEKFVYIDNADGWTEIWFVNIGEPRKMIDRVRTLEPTTSQNIIWSPNDELFAVLTNTFGGLYRRSGERIDTDVLSLRVDEDIFWHPTNDYTIYRHGQGGYETIEIVDDIAQAGVLEDNLTFSMPTETLTFIQTPSHTELHKQSNEGGGLVALLPRSDYQIAHRDAEKMILTNADGHLLLIDISVQQPILLDVVATEFDWLEDSQKMVYTDGSEVNIYNASSHETTFVTRQGSALAAVEWHESGTHILLASSNNITASEAYKIAEKRITTTLMEFDDIKTVWFDATSKYAYLFGVIDGGSGVHQLRLVK
jgi:hypothetical protein